jgi:hypothetical protein
MLSALHGQRRLMSRRSDSGCDQARSRGGVSALPHVAMTVIVPYCRIEHNPGRPKNAKPGGGSDMRNRKEAMRQPAD